MVELFANSGDPDEMLHSAVSDLGLHCLPITCLGVCNGLNCIDIMKVGLGLCCSRVPKEHFLTLWLRLVWPQYKIPC